MYNITDLMNTTDWGSYLTIIDRESGYLLGIVLLVVSMIIWILTFVNKEGFVNALIVSGFVSTIEAIIMFGMGVLAPHFIILPLLLVGGGLIAKKLGGD
jgi:hypothetical protein